MKFSHNLFYFKLFSIEANILPISANHNDFYTISIDINDETTDNDIFTFFSSILDELKDCNSDGDTSSAFIIANYYNVFKTITTKVIVIITYCKQNIRIEHMEEFI